MRGLKAASLVGCLLMASAGTTWAEEPSPSPFVAGQRVIATEAGFAVTLPIGWTALTPDDIDPQRLIETAGCSTEACVAVLAGAIAAGDAEILKLVALGPQTASPTGLVENCMFTSWPDAIPLEEQVPLLMEAIRIVNGDKLVSGPDSVPVELPTGEAVRVDHVASGVSLRLPDGEGGSVPYNVVVPGGVHGSTYTRTHEQSVYNMICKSLDLPPDDDWLSIAETFEFLPAEE